MNRLLSFVTHLAVILIICLAFPSILKADVYYCEGKWTNTKCDEKPSKIIEETVRTTRNPEASRISKRKLWLHDLEMLRLRAKREHGVSVSTLSARDTCLSLENEDDKCRQIIDSKEKELNDLILSYKKLALEKEKNKAESEKKEVKSEQQVIVIKENRRIHRRRHYHPHGTSTQSGAGISVSTTSSDGRTTISGSAGYQTSEHKRPPKPIMGTAK